LTALSATGARTFDPSQPAKRADRAWRVAGLERITLHECRHTFASLMIAAEVNAKALQSFMGHAGISITLDRYGALPRPGCTASDADRGRGLGRCRRDAAGVRCGGWRGAAGGGLRQARVLQPGGSVKDRIGVAMIDAAERTG
jgi:hypothetical protein